MQVVQSPPPKPVSELWQPELTRLPCLTCSRRFFRGVIRAICRFAVFVCTRISISGMEYFPSQGPALVVMNHLGDPDAIIQVACLPEMPEAVAKIELRKIPILGAVIEAYGVIWVHRGRADRRAIEVALKALRQGRKLIIAPEGRESLTGALERGTDGAAFLALKANASIIPVTLTGSETWRVLENLRKFKRTPITLTVGKPFTLPHNHGHLRTVKEGTRQIMEALARQLPEEYRGFYSYVGNYQ